MTNTQQFLDWLDNAETIGAEVASKLAPWLAPLLSAVVVGQAVQHEPFSWDLWQAILLGATLELMGIATLSTVMMLYSHWQQQPADRKPSPAPMILAGCGVVVYVCTVAAITVLLKLPLLAGWEGYTVTLVYVGVLALAITSAVNLTVRRDHYRLINQPKKPKRPQTARSKRPVKKALNDQTAEERLANLDYANQVRQPTPANFSYAARLKAEGSTWEQVADAIGKSTSTAKEWAKKAGHQPVASNGNGAHQ